VILEIETLSSLCFPSDTLGRKPSIEKTKKCLQQNVFKAFYLSNLKKYQGRLEGLGKVFVVRIGLMKFRLGYFEVMIR